LTCQILSVHDLLLSSDASQEDMRRKRSDVLIAFLSLADIIVLVALLSSTGVANIGIYSFDTLVVALIAFSFCRRMKKSQQWRRFLFNNWYEIAGLIPIVVFALA
jgi:voltage-gated potassium channel